MRSASELEIDEWLDIAGLDLDDDVDDDDDEQGLKYEGKFCDEAVEPVEE